MICGRVVLALHQKGAEGRYQRENATAKASLQQSLADWKNAINELELSEFDLTSAEAQDHSSFKPPGVVRVAVPQRHVDA